MTDASKKVMKKNLRATTVLNKEGGLGPARYDHDHRFNVVFLKPSLSNWKEMSWFFAKIVQVAKYVGNCCCARAKGS